ncbi:MAG: LysR family transcriptional regulator [Kiloniellales bacterium]
MADRSIDLNALNCLDAVARFGSLTRAAATLGMSQPAVSYQIRKLEQQLKTPLFLREHRGVRPTEAGQLLCRVAQDSLARLRSAMSEVQERRDGPRVTVASDFSFATYWLTPRLASYRAIAPDVDVQIVAAQHESQSGGDVDVTVLYGASSLLGRSAVRLSRERVVPVCSSAFLRKHGPFHDSRDLLRQPLLHLEGGDETRWFTWQSWCAAQSIDYRPQGPQAHFNMCSLQMHAAMDGQGLALGWVDVIQSLLELGLLVPATSEYAVSERGFFARLEGAKPSAAARTMFDWICTTLRDDIAVAAARAEAGERRAS